MFIKRSPGGPGYIILNAIRAMNIIGLLAVIAASSVMLVKTFVVSKFFFFDAITHVITAFLSLFLIITEFPLFRNYVARNWPLFSPSSGLVTLGVTMVVLGVSILGNLNKKATSQKSLGTSFWRIVISSGILVVILGVINIFASYIFRDSSRGITARQYRSHGAVADQKVVSSASSATSRRRSFHLGRADTLPSYRTETQHVAPHRNISAPVNDVSPSQFSKFDNQCNDIERPDLAHHPAMTGRF